MFIELFHIRKSIEYFLEIINIDKKVFFAIFLAFI